MSSIREALAGQRTIGSRFDAGITGGFDYQRLLLALLVLLWHSWSVTYGYSLRSPEWYQLFTRMVLPLFFALSGFLVASSLDRLQDLPTFGLLRFLRIFPALCVEILLSALILGPLLTTLPLKEYFTDPQLYTYLLNTIGIIHYDLPGLFKENPVTWVNRSLWTVPFELECYVMLAGLYLIGFYRRTWLLVVSLAALSIFCFFFYREYSYETAPLVPGRLLIAYFLAGNIVFKLRGRLPGGPWLGIGALALSYLLLTNVAATMLSPLLIAYASAALGCTGPKKLPIVFYGDYSYGLYLYAFPIQQAVYLLLHTRTMGENFAYSAVITAIFAAFSWHYIEKPIVGLKKRLLKKRVAPPTEPAMPADGATKPGSAAENA